MVTIRWCYGATLLRERHPTTWNDFVVHHSIYGLTTWLALRNAQSNIQAALGAGCGSALTPAGSALFG
jgi:hypothetical protein